MFAVPAPCWADQVIGGGNSSRGGTVEIRPATADLNRDIPNVRSARHHAGPTELSAAEIQPRPDRRNPSGNCGLEPGHPATFVVPGTVRVDRVIVAR
jgi:hypothetical protein